VGEIILKVIMYGVFGWIVLWFTYPLIFLDFDGYGILLLRILSFIVGIYIFRWLFMDLPNEEGF